MNFIILTMHYPVLSKKATVCFGFPQRFGTQAKINSLCTKFLAHKYPSLGSLVNKFVYRTLRKTIKFGRNYFFFNLKSKNIRRNSIWKTQSFQFTNVTCFFPFFLFPFLIWCTVYFILAILLYFFVLNTSCRYFYVSRWPSV